MSQQVPKPVTQAWKVTEVKPWESNDGMTLKLSSDDERVHYGWIEIAFKGIEWPRYVKDDEIILTLRVAKK